MSFISLSASHGSLELSIIFFEIIQTSNLEIILNIMCGICISKVIVYWICIRRLFTEKPLWLLEIWLEVLCGKTGSSSMFGLVKGCKFAAQIEIKTYIWFCTHIASPKSKSWSCRETQILT